MNLNEIYVSDIETNGIWATKIHCFCYQKLGSNDIVALTRYEDIKNFLSTPGITLVGHNYVKYDMPTLERLLGFKFKGVIADTLGLSWILQPERKQHGLEIYGEEFGVPKPAISDWENLSVEEYIHRCTEDVKINMKLWRDQWNYLLELYDNNINAIISFINYIQFKLTMVSEQETIGVKLDIRKCQEMISRLSAEKQEKLLALTSAMPPVKIMGVKEMPKVMFKKDGTLSSHGLKWLQFLEAHNLPADHMEPVQYLKGYEEPNPNSHVQRKDWLYSLGWVPEHIKYDRNKETGEIKEIPQIKHKDPDREGEVCESIKRLFETEPSLEIMEGLSIISHRISVFEGFLRDQRNGRLHPGNSGFTNTMRLTHKVIANLPKVSRLYGADIRGSLIADEGHIMCGSDLSNIESSTRNHYIFPHDPNYVHNMSEFGFDSHVDIAVLAGFITVADEEFFKWKSTEGYKIKEQFLNINSFFGPTLSELLALDAGEQKKILTKIKEQRQKGKTVNFAAVYGVGAPTLSRNSGLSEDLCKKLLETYWQRNWSVRAVADSCYVKTVRGQMWLYNPISKFYYTLRADKDKFSTLNQGSAVYVFDVWCSFVRKEGIKVCLQYHDEILFNCFIGNNTIEEVKEEYTSRVKRAMDKTNAMLKLNVTIDCSADYGFNYSECH